MNRDMNFLLVIDLESTCWEGQPPPGQVSEIIEIGVTEVDVKNLKLLRSESLLARPSRSTVSEFCTKLTGHTAEELHEKGTSILKAFDRLVDGFAARTRPWASWGAYDRNMIQSVSYFHQVQSPVTQQHINVKTLFSLVHGLPVELGMAEALQRMSWPLEGRHHNGMDDSKNIAKLLIDVLRRSRQGM